MASILELFGENGPKTSQINRKGKDKTPISPDGGLDLANDSNLEKMLVSKVDTGKYTNKIPSDGK